MMPMADSGTLSVNRVMPDAARARALSGEVHRRMAASLAYVFEAAGPALGLDADKIGVWMERFAQADRAPPMAHARYHAMVAAIQGNDLDLALLEAGRLLDMQMDAAALDMFNLDDAALGEGATALICRFADIEEANRLDLIPAASRDIDAFRLLLADAEIMMRDHHPELHGEFHALISTLLAVDQAEERKFTLGAVSCFQLWGSLIINPALQQDALTLVATIAHECTHLLLFAMAMDEPLVLNPPDERHYSPLRNEMRSVDGIYHATIVSARMAHAYVQQMNSGMLPADIARVAPEWLFVALRAFDSGLAVLEDKSRLTKTGREILDDAIELVAGYPRARAVSATD